ncbi:putative GNAT family acetyltransferase [Annulohypoxylon bovei var. microspora]|nr:putative GNAT family acetyltransferase [Annulohypoxylon bovei var. microspora]
MPLTLANAGREDAVRIAEIHMAAFGSNAMLLAQFPTTAVRDALKRCIQLKALADIDDPNITVLVVRDSDFADISNTIELGENEQASKHQAGGRVIAFAKWAHPVPTDEDYIEPSWIWPEGTNLDIIEDWTKKTEEAQAHAVGVAPCYHLTFIGTDPVYERRGAATMMTQWGIDQSKKYHVPAYLESTLEAAPFYRKLGFSEVEKFSLSYKVDGSGVTEIYEEISFIYK